MYSGLIVSGMTRNAIFIFLKYINVMVVKHYAILKWNTLLYTILQTRTRRSSFIHTNSFDFNGAPTMSKVIHMR